MVGAKSLAAVFTGCVDTLGRASCSAILSTSYVKVALVVELVGAGSLGAGSLVALGRGLLAVWSLVVEAASAIVAVLALFDPLACLVARFGLSMDLCAAFAVLAVTSLLEA